MDAHRQLRKRNEVQSCSLHSETSTVVRSHLHCSSPSESTGANADGPHIACVNAQTILRFLCWLGFSFNESPISSSTHPDAPVRHRCCAATARTPGRTGGSRWAGRV